MPLQEIQPLCPICDTPLEKAKGRFGLFWGCRNFKNPDHKDFKGWPIKGERPKDKPNKTEQVDPTLLILDEVRTLNIRLDKLGEYFVEQFDKIIKKLE